MTPEQRKTLAENPHLLLVEFLPDDDILVLDTEEPARDGLFSLTTGHYGPYILTRSGKVQDVHRHYRTHHLAPVFDEGR